MDMSENPCSIRKYIHWGYTEFELEFKEYSVKLSYCAFLREGYPRDERVKHVESESTKRAGLL